LDVKNITLLVTEKDKPVKALAFLLDKPAIAQKFETLTGAEWVGFVNGEAKRLGIKMTAAAVQFLADVYQATPGRHYRTSKARGFVVPGKNGAVGSAAIDRKDLNVFDLEVAPNYWGLMNGLKSYDLKTGFTPSSPCSRS